MNRLLAVCRRLIDGDAQPVTMHRDTVLRAVTRVGEVIVKTYPDPARRQQEVHAYRQWTPALGSHAPQLLATIDEPSTIIVTALPGYPLAEADLPTVDEAQAHRQAGLLLHLLHHAGPPRALPDVTAWLAGRGEQWLALAEDLLPYSRRREIRARLRALPQLDPIPAVPCHLDYTPGNILVTDTGAVAVIDFEHSRYDLAARDLVRLATRTWPHRPDLKDAFLRGHGPLSDLDQEIIDHCAHLDALTAAVRAAGRNLPTTGPPGF